MARMRRLLFLSILALSFASQANPLFEDEKSYQLLLSSTTGVWEELFMRQGAQYRPPHLEFTKTAVTPTPCGDLSAGMGPFYCASDETIYMNLRQVRAVLLPTDDHAEATRAYVFAHTVGHHVQKLSRILGLLSDGDYLGRRNFILSMEYQADCYAGIWASQAHRRVTLVDPSLISQESRNIPLGAVILASFGQQFPHLMLHGEASTRLHWLETGMMGQNDLSVCESYHVFKQ